MIKPVLNIDATFIDSGKPLDKPFTVSNDYDGILLLIDKLRNLQALTEKTPDVI